MNGSVRLYAMYICIAYNRGSITVPIIQISKLRLEVVIISRSHELLVDLGFKPVCSLSV